MHSQRIQFLDIMRGLAVVVMVMGHSIDSVLSLDARVTDVFRLYDAVRGFTAPIFLFVSGFVFAIATERRWMDYRSFTPALRSRILKVFLLLVIGYALHLPFLSFNKLLHDTRPEEYAQLFQVDVLHCVAISLLILHVIVLFSKTPRLFSRVAMATTAVLVLATPLLWPLDLSRIVTPAFAPYFNQTNVSIFPVFPYSAFMLAGAVAGHFFVAARARQRELDFFRAVVRLALLAALCGVVFDLLPVSIYPPHDYWKASPNFFLIRLGAVLLVTAVYYFIKKWPVMIEHPVRALSQASLMVYAVHLVVVYGSAANPGLQQVVGKTLPYYAAAGVGMAVLGGMIVLAYFWNYARTHHLWPSRFIQAGFASTIIYLFFTKPW